MLTSARGTARGATRVGEFASNGEDGHDQNGKDKEGHGQMAWTVIEHACGHAERRQIYGPMRDRPRKAEWWATKPCTECWKKARKCKTHNRIDCEDLMCVVEEVHDL